VPNGVARIKMIDVEQAQRTGSSAGELVGDSPAQGASADNADLSLG
jgi:hypothetical protein